VPALPSWLTNPLWDQFAALLPQRSTFDPTHPLRCHRRRIPDRIAAKWMHQAGSDWTRTTGSDAGVHIDDLRKIAGHGSITATQ
jgi:hypothetical protein